MHMHDFCACPIRPWSVLKHSKYILFCCDQMMDYVHWWNQSEVVGSSWTMIHYLRHWVSSACSTGKRVIWHHMWCTCKILYSIQLSKENFVCGLQEEKLIKYKRCPDSRVCIRLKCGHCSQGGPFSDFSIFAPLHAFFGIFIYKIGIYDPDLA
jgi:hypothetical protein